MKDNPVLLDTNVLVYAYDSGAGSKHKKAKELLLDTLINAFELTENYGIHFWDATIAASMLEFGITDIITENIKDFSKVKQIKAINPFK